MSYFFTGKMIVQMMKSLTIPIFITLCVFISNILVFAYNRHHTLLRLEKKIDKYDNKNKQYRNENSNDPATISRRLDDWEQDLQHKTKNVHDNVCMKTEWLNRIIHRRPPWFVNHVMLNKMKETEFINRENQAWDKFINNPQRLINIAYACVNGYLSYNAMQAYRIAVCYILLFLLFCHILLIM